MTTRTMNATCRIHDVKKAFFRSATANGRMPPARLRKSALSLTTRHNAPIPSKNVRMAQSDAMASRSNHAPVASGLHCRVLENVSKTTAASRVLPIPNHAQAAQNDAMAMHLSHASVVSGLHCRVLENASRITVASRASSPPGNAPMAQNGAMASRSNHVSVASGLHCRVLENASKITAASRVSSPRLNLAKKAQRNAMTTAPRLFSGHAVTRAPGLKRTVPPAK